MTNIKPVIAALAAIILIACSAGPLHAQARRRIRTVRTTTTTTTTTTGPTRGVRAAFEAGDNTIGLALGVAEAYSYSYLGTVTNLPSFSVYYDRGIVSNVGPGTIGIGGMIGYQTSYYDYGNGSGDRDHWTNVAFGVRATYHLTLLKAKNNKFDPYGGVFLGFRSETYTNHYTVSNPYRYGGVYAVAGPFIGAKYNFVPQFGVLAEVGYSISLLRIGVNFNF